MARKGNKKIKITHKDLVSATISTNNEFVEECFRDQNTENSFLVAGLLFTELFQQEWRIYLLSMPDSRYKKDIPSLRKEAVKLRNNLRERFGDDAFRKAYDYFRQHCSYKVDGRIVPQFNDREYPVRTKNKSKLVTKSRKAGK